MSPAKGVSGRSQVTAAKDASKHMLKKGLRLMDSWEALTKTEVQHLISHLDNNLNSNEEMTFETSLGLLLSLTFGTLIDDFSLCSHVNDLDSKDIVGKRIFCLENNLIYYRAQIPHYKTKLPSEIAEYFMPSASLGWLAPPAPILIMLLRLTQSKKVSTRIRPLFSQEHAVRAHQILKSINDTFSTRLSLDRVAHYLTFVVINKFGDKGLLGLLGLLKQDISTQNHYANASVSKINECYQHALKSFPFDLGRDEQADKNLSIFQKLNHLIALDQEIWFLNPMLTNLLID